MKKIPKGIINVVGLPYSTAVEIGQSFVSFSGQLPDLDDNKKPISISLSDQTRQLLKKIKKLLNDCGFSFNNLFDVMIFLHGEVSAENYAIVNGIYEEFLKADKVSDAPDRLFVGNLSLPFGVEIEIKFKAVTQVPEFLSTSSSVNDGE